MHEENSEQQWSQPRKRKAISKKWSVVHMKPTRQSVRLVKDGITISEKVARRVEELNNISGNSFALFHLVNH
jgi:hypothetical protein